MTPAMIGRIVRYPGSTERGFVRIFTAAVVTLALVGSLSACASVSAPSGACDTGPTPGSASKLITATGASGTEPKVEFPTPLVTDGLEVSTIKKGTGAVVYPGQAADIHITVVNAKTGEILTNTGVTPSDILLRSTTKSSSTKVDTIGQMLVCATVGSRLAVTTTVKATFGDTMLGLPAKDSVVFIIDVVKRYIGRADGVDQVPVAGMPAVVLAPSGQPGIVIPKVKAPKTTRIETLKLGDGAKVAKGDYIVIQYSAIVWGGTATFASSWADGAPATFIAAKDATGGTTGGVVPGLYKALIGAKVGSQVIAVVGPKDGYAADATLPDGVVAGDTLVYVVDVLGIHELEK